MTRWPRTPTHDWAEPKRRGAAVRIADAAVGTGDAELFSCHRDRPGPVALGGELPEEHWSGAAGANLAGSGQRAAGRGTSGRASLASAGSSRRGPPGHSRFSPVAPWHQSNVPVAPRDTTFPGRGATGTQRRPGRPPANRLPTFRRCHICRGRDHGAGWAKAAILVTGRSPRRARRTGRPLGRQRPQGGGSGRKTVTVAVTALSVDLHLHWDIPLAGGSAGKTLPTYSTAGLRVKCAQLASPG